ncbi:MAG: hypothetical protein A2V85_14175 [Chloroflexi bacterium RBG_16_72_14]|nr:MAG: hypothetical protein A2V85_14175 [Chloroflexi bacterium RBG_16_72_14]
MSPTLPELGRFTETSICILAALTAGPRHSIALATEVGAMTGSPVGPATLLGSLARLECHGLIRALDAAPGPRRYRITELGASALPGQAHPTHPVVRTAHVRLEEAPR